jgi:hypothetical protein
LSVIDILATKIDDLSVKELCFQVEFDECDFSLS